MVHRIEFCWVAFDLTNIMHIAHQNTHTRLVAKSSWKPYKRTQRTRKNKRNEQLIWAHKICKNKKKLECILEKNASTKKKPCHHTKFQQNSSLHNEWQRTQRKVQTFLLFRVWDNKNLKNLKHLNAYPSTLRKSKTLKSRYA